MFENPYLSGQQATNPRPSEKKAKKMSVVNINETKLNSILIKSAQVINFRTGRHATFRNQKIIRSADKGKRAGAVSS